MNLIVIVYLFCSYAELAAGIFQPSEFVKKIMSTDWNPLNNTQFNSNVYLNTTQIISKAGYRAETHVVMTEDGYLLTLHRIPGGNNSLPVLVMHGFASSSADWVILGKGKALPYLLANEGYDVWLGNFRGNTFSKAHISLSPSEPKFWDFSFHEMGVYDIPAMITFITNVTLKSSLHTYIGHSMGTSTFYVMAAQRREIAQKVRMMISMGPAAFLNHMKSPIRYVLDIKHYEMILRLFFSRHGELFDLSNSTRNILKSSCTQNFVEMEICANVFFFIAGYDPEQFNNTLLSTIFNNFPAVSSLKTFVHFGQVTQTGKFRQFDYGSAKNLLTYKSLTPPKYDITKITVPIALFYGINDLIVTPTDVMQLYHVLPNVLDLYEVPWSKFNHLDFLWAKDAPKLVYERVFKLMRGKNLNNVTLILIRFFFHDYLLSNIVRFLLTYGCDRNIVGDVCANAMFMIWGFDREQFNYTLLPVILRNFPAGGSANTIFHYTQGFKSGKFRQYDYGPEKNLLIYNSVEPPDYDIANITIPIALFYGLGDWLENSMDVKRLYRILPNVVDIYEVPWPDFNHADFIWAKDAFKLVYERILKIMREQRT